MFIFPLFTQGSEFHIQAAFSAATTACGRTTATRRLSALQHAIDKRSGATDSGIHSYGPEGAILGAGPTFHAKVSIEQFRLLSIHAKNPMRAHLDTAAAACALFRKKL